MTNIKYAKLDILGVFSQTKAKRTELLEAQKFPNYSRGGSDASVVNRYEAVSFSIEKGRIHTLHTGKVYPSLLGTCETFFRFSFPAGPGRDR